MISVHRATSRIGAVLSALVLAISASTCKLGELVNPSRSGVLSLSPLSVADSAPVGSSAARTLSVSVKTDAGIEGLAWTARIAHGSGWLHLAPLSGSTPDSAVLSLDPTGLAVGTYRDTVLFSIAINAAAPVAVPVEFRVVGCLVSDVSPTIVLQDSLTARDCAAPGRAGRFGRLFGFNATSGDSISVRLFATGFDGFLVLDSVPGTATLAQNDNCVAGGSDPCLNYVLLTRTGRYVIEATSANAGATGLFRLDILRPRPPVAPDTLRQIMADLVTPVAIGGAVDVGSIELRGTVSDPDFDSTRLEVEVRPLGTAFTNVATGQSGPVATGQLAAVSVSGLNDDVSYHWQGRAVDRTGRASAWLAFGGNAETAADFRVAVPQAPAGPASPAQFKSDGATAIPVGGTNDAATALFQATLSDPDPGDQLRLEVEVRALGSAFTNTATGSSTAVANGGVATATVAGLSDNAAYHWQTRTVDQTGRASAWTSFGGNAESAADFRVAITPSRLTVTVQPATTAAGAAISPAVQVAAQDAAGNTLASFTGTVTVSLGTNPAGGTLSGTTSAAAVAGVATFTTLSINRAASGYTLQASGTGFTVTSAAFAVTPGAATRLDFQVQPANGVAGAVLSPAIQVTALDALGNVATGFTATVQMAIGSNPGGATLAGTTAVAAAAGVATFSTLSLNRAATGYTLAASATGLTGATSTAFDIAAGTAGTLVLVQQPSAAASSGAALAVQPIVQLQDGAGNAVAQSGLVVTATVNGSPAGVSLAGASATTDATGKATFSGLTIAGPVGSYVLNFSASGVGSTGSNAIVLGAGPAAKLQIQSQPSATATSAVPFAQQPTLQVQDVSGNAVAAAGVVVSAAIATGGGTLGGTTTATTSASGRASFANLSISGAAGARTLSFSAAGLTGTTSATVTLGAGAATQIAAQAGAGQTATAGSAVSTAPAVLVRDASGNPVAGVNVSFAVTGGGGTVVPVAPVATGSNGIAAATSWTLGTVAGANTLSATAPGLTGSPVTFTATGTAGPPAQFAKTAGDNVSGPAGTTLATALQATVADANGNPVAGVSVTWAAASGGGSVNPSVSTTDAAGHATTSRTLGSATGIQTTTATATISGAPATLTYTATANPGNASQMTLSAGDNQSDTVAATLATPLAVLVRDNLGNPVAGVTITWSVTAGGGAVQPGTSLTNGAGVATAAWTLGTVAGPGIARASGVASPINFVSTALAGNVNASQTTVAAAPGSITASSGGSASTVTVTVKDGFGNPIAGKSVTLSASGSGNTIGQPSSASSALGVASGTFASSTAGQHTVAAVAGGVAITQQPAVSVAPDVATALAFTVQPANVVAGAAISPAVKVEIRDAFANIVTTATSSVTVALASNPGSGTLSGTLTTSAVAGVATFANLSVNRPASGYTLAATSGTLTLATSSAFNVAIGAASPATSTVSVGAGTVASGSATTVTLQAKDAAGNNLTTGGLTVAFTQGGGVSTGTFGGVTDNGNGSYTASFTGVLSGTATTIGATIGGVAITTALPTVTVTPGPVSTAASVATASPTGIISGATSTVTLQAKDAAGNSIASGGLTVVFAPVASGTSTVTPASVAATDNGNGTYSGVFTGVAVGTPRSIGATIGGVAITSTLPTITVSPGLASPATSVVSVNGSTVVSGATLTASLQAKDAAGNNRTVGGETVVFSLSGGASTASFGTTTDNGNGTYAATLTGVLAGTASQVHASINGAAVTTAAPGVTVTPGAVAAATSSIGVSSNTVVSGNAITLTLQARDAAGNNLTAGGATVVFTQTGGTSAGTFSGTTDNGDGTYSATFTGTTAGTATTIGATINAVATTSTQPVTVTLGSVSPATSTVAVSSGTVASGGTITLTLQAKDAAGNSLTSGGATVAFTSSGGTSTGTIGATTDNGNGTYAATFTGLVAGTATTIGATINSVATTSTQPVTVTAGAISPATSALSVSNGSVIEGGSITLTLQGKDAAGNDLATGGAIVAFAASGGTSVGSISSTTDHGNGTYTATFTGVTAGTATTISATIGGSAVTSTQSVTVMPGAATHLSVTAPPPATMAAGASFGVQIEALNSSGTVDPNFTGTISLALAGGPGGAVLNGTTSLAASGGAVTFSGLSVDQAGTGYTLNVTTSSGGVTGTATSAFAVTPGTATHLVFTTPPSTATAGAAAIGAVVEARDNFGNLDPAFASNVDVALSGGTSGAALSGTVSVAPSGGVATFSGLSIDSAGAGYQLAASSPTASPAVTGAASAAFAIRPGAATHIAFRQQPGNTAAGTSITPAVTVRALDALGNVDTSFAGSVAVAITGGSGTPNAHLSGGSSVAATASHGIASFATLSIDSAGTGYTLTASDQSGASLGSAASTAFDIATGPASVLVYTTQPANTTAGSGFGVVLTARDAGGNVATGYDNQPVTLSITAGTGANGAALGGTTTVNTSAGIATFAGLSLTQASTTYRLDGNSGSLGTATSNVFTIQALSASHYAFGPIANQTAGSGFGVTVTARDQFNNIDLGKNGETVQLSIHGGTGTTGAVLGGTTLLTTSAGSATFTNLTIDSAGAAYQLDATNNLLLSGTSAAFNVAPGAATHLGYGQQPSNVVAGAAISPAMTVRALDAVGNVDTSYAGSVTLAIATGTAGAAFTASATTAVGAVHGMATLANVRIDSAGTNFSLRASSGTTTQAVSGTFAVQVGPASTARTLVSVSQASVTVGGTSTITLTAMDSVGNRLTTGGLTVVFSMSSTGTGTGTITTPQDNNNGTYTATFTGTKKDAAHPITISATINGQLVIDTASIQVH